MQHKQDWMGITTNTTDGVAPVPVYQDDNGVQTFVTDENYPMLV